MSARQPAEVADRLAVPRIAAPKGLGLQPYFAPILGRRLIDDVQDAHGEDHLLARALGPQTFADHSAK